MNECAARRRSHSEVEPGEHGRMPNGGTVDRIPGSQSLPRPDCSKRPPAHRARDGDRGPRRSVRKAIREDSSPKSSHRTASLAPCIRSLKKSPDIRGPPPRDSGHRASRRTAGRWWHSQPQPSIRSALRKSSHRAEPRRRRSGRRVGGAWSRPSLYYKYACIMRCHVGQSWLL